MTKQGPEMTTKLFALLDVYHEAGAHSAAMNMAIDEALLEYAPIPLIRFYHWLSPALSFGYFGRFSDVASYQGERDLVRRWTGGGIVFHGEDLTYSLVVPANHAAFDESSMSIYEKIHRALCDALSGIGMCTQLVASELCADRMPRSSVPPYSCFENPVRADVVIDGRKVAGAAQRRTRRALLQQGSVQSVDLENGLAQRFIQALSTDYSERKLDEEILNRARELAEQKYGTDSWLRKR
jgi:lipoyl(octanoyl) transferase